MNELVTYIIKNLVAKPEAVNIDEQRGEDGSVNFVVSVDPEDMGFVIGKAGQTIKAIRKLLLIRAITENMRVNLELKEPPAVSPSES